MKKTHLKAALSLTLTCSIIGRASGEEVVARPAMTQDAAFTGPRYPARRSGKPVTQVEVALVEVAGRTRLLMRRNV